MHFQIRHAIVWIVAAKIGQIHLYMSPQVLLYTKEQTDLHIHLFFEPVRMLNYTQDRQNLQIYPGQTYMTGGLSLWFTANLIRNCRKITAAI